MITAGVLAKQSDVPLFTVRYYTRIGLLKPLRNSQNGYKIYQPSDETRLRHKYSWTGISGRSVQPPIFGSIQPPSLHRDDSFTRMSGCFGTAAWCFRALLSRYRQWSINADYRNAKFIVRPLSNLRLPAADWPKRSAQRQRAELAESSTTPFD